jgi:hypothetical protein
MAAAPVRFLRDHIHFESGHKLLIGEIGGEFRVQRS